MGNKQIQIDILEQRGLWKASSSIARVANKLRKKSEPVRIGYIKEAHKNIFKAIKPFEDMAGKYRNTDGPEVERINGTYLKIARWRDIPNRMAILDSKLKEETKGLSRPTTPEEYKKIIDLAVLSSHELVCIHPFENGNGRTSRLLIDLILLRADLYKISIKDNKIAYLNAMLQADKGDLEPLIILISKSLLEASEKIYKGTQERYSEEKLRKQKGLFDRIRL